MRALIHIANLLFLLSYLVRDILWLRLLTLVAGVLLVIYFATQPQPQLEPVAWNALFLALNVLQIARIVSERRPVLLTGDEAALHRMAFQALSARDFRKLAGIGAWRTAAEGEELVAEGKPLSRLLALHEGQVAVEARGQRLVELCPGRLIGEMSFLTSSPTSARVVALSPCRYLEWPAAELRSLMQREPELRAAFQLVIGTDLVEKLRRA